MAKKRRLPVRTTLSLPAELGSRAEVLADRLGVPVVALAREAIDAFVRLHDRATDSGPQDPVGHAWRVLRDAARLDNPYQKLVANWRLSRAERQVGDIAGRKMEIDLWPGDIYLLRILTELLQSLGESDHMLVVSNVHFWRSGSGSLLTRDSAEHFLAAQEHAVRRGLRLHRVFLLGPDDATASELRPHLEFLQRVRSAASESTQVSIEFRAFENVESALLQYGHFACLRRLGSGRDNGDEGCMIAEPVYYGPSRQVHLRLLFSRLSGDSDPLTRPYLDRFSEVREGARPIEELNDHVGSTRATTR